MIILEKLFLGKLLEKIPWFFQWLYTMLLVVLGWVLFDTADIATAGNYIATMFGASGIGVDNQAWYLLLNYGVILVICFFASSDAFKRLVEMAREKFPKVVNYSTPVLKTAVMFFATAYLVDATYNPFLYFNF